MQEKKIGWQKYEDVLEDQLHCPFVQEIMTHLQLQEQSIIEELMQTGDYGDTNGEEEIQIPIQTQSVAVSEELLKEAAVLANFDCWGGHSNFDITPSIKSCIEKTGGVEVLKVQSRYRFFIGIGRMFNFSDVRKEIEKRLFE